MIQWVHANPPDVEHHIYHSEAMGCDVGCNVYTPPDATGSPPYPVIYWLHGAGGTENSGLVILRRVRQAIAQGLIPPVMMVFANGGQRTMYSDSADGTILSETTIMEELIPWVESRYPVIPARGGRAIQGFSMGGYGALKLGIKFAHRFSSVVSMGGALHDLASLAGRREDIYETMFNGEPEAFRAHSPHDLIKEHREYVRARQHIQIYVGSGDLTLPMNEKFHALLQELGVRHHYEVLEGARHNVREYYMQAGDAILQFHAQHFVPVPPGVEVLGDLEYRRVDGEALHLDLYRPKNRRGPLPVVLFIHGGAWIFGSKDFRPLTLLAAHGYAVASFNYRLSRQAPFPAQLEDCHAALRWLRAQAGRYDLDPGRIGVVGPSAGGHLASLVGVTGDGTQVLPGGDGDAAPVKAVVDFFGPSDLLVLRQSRQDQGGPDFSGRLLGGPVQKRRKLARLASPAHHVNPGHTYPPFLIIHGDQDSSVPVEQSRLLYERLQGAGAQADLYIVAGGEHGLPRIWNDQVEERVIQFFDQHLKG